jgi:hypothetical protein
VIRANDRDAFRAAFARSLRIAAAAGSAGLLVENYLPGAEVALEGIVDAGRLITLALFDKPDPLEGPFFEESIYVTPSRLPASLESAAVDEAAKVIEALGLGPGPVHVELRVHETKPTAIEIAPRSIGGLCSRALRFTGGQSLEMMLLRAALGDDPGSFRRESLAAGVLMIPIPRAGVLKAVRGRAQALEVTAIEEVRLTIPPGEVLVPLPEGSRYLGFVFARADRPEVVEAALRAAHARLEIDIEDRDPVLPRVTGDR